VFAGLELASIRTIAAVTVRLPAARSVSQFHAHHNDQLVVWSKGHLLDWALAQTKVESNAKKRPGAGAAVSRARARALLVGVFSCGVLATYHARASPVSDGGLGPPAAVPRVGAGPNLRAQASTN
jgi:hypothetical protein